MVTLGFRFWKAKKQQHVVDTFTQQVYTPGLGWRSCLMRQNWLLLLLTWNHCAIEIVALYLGRLRPQTPLRQGHMMPLNQDKAFTFRFAESKRKMGSRGMIPSGAGDSVPQ